jgi:O-antigen ligase
VFFLLLGWAWQLITGLHESRVKGFLPNPNNFALTAMVLLYLTNEARSRFIVRAMSHALVIAMIYVSNTGGAIFGYLIGIIHRVYSVKKHRLRLILTLGIVILSITLAFTILPLHSFKPLETTARKIAVAKENLNLILAHKQINFYEIIQKEKQDTTSLLWRLGQWYNISAYLIASPADKLLFGYGIGTTDAVFKAKSHNDYLRILFETGLIGFIFNLMMWVTIYRGMRPDARWLVTMIAVFSFTENNYDHFPAMSLLVFYMLGSKSQNVRQ